MARARSAGCTDFRKHVAWYLKGFAVGGDAARRAGAWSSSLAELDDLLAELDPDQPFPAACSDGPRGRTTGTQPVALPDGWLADPTTAPRPSRADAELDTSGG